MSLRERKKQDKLARIERAARTLFSANGYDQTTTRAIAEEAGIGVGTLFVYFPEKRDLLFHLFSSAVRGVKDNAFAELPEGTLVDRVMFVFTRYFDYYAKDLGLSRVFVKEMGFAPTHDRTQLNSLTLELLTALADLVSEAQRAGEVDSGVNTMTAAVHLFSLYTASVISWLGGSIPVRENQLAMLRNMIALLYRGMEPRT